MLTEASREGRPYSVVYLDMRIPPGWDGLKTAEMIRSVDQTVRIILITAYSDYSMTAIRSRIGVDFHFLNKPVDKKELLQLTQMLVDQWNQFNELQFYREQLENQVSDLRNQVAEMDEEEKKLNQLARTDALTGVCNRLVLEERFKEAQIRVNRSPKMLGILLLDLDKFKEVNDTEGHHVGDAFLIETAKRLVQEVRQSDVVIRLGGDEFCILAEGLTEDGVTILIQRLRMSLESSFIFEDKNYLIHCSIGYTLALSGTETLETLMKQADQSMYEEKRRKR